ncbi:acyl CoA transferase/carnitine dehydratase [Legionella gratiana]|uniref:Acyl CoA transferase/carnitine dehydratase n=1 Tax=Legionella gratiana TaxID=45066 RepID=A0A378JGM7_9GAMM|nr:CoA transferase [Legionella gratiana]KTD11902.1 acyl CoA transferase/carnitine dehydratase [Legionella gratiana]STX46506.1 acyl CoA transferase/carnitine dehydratase [Legionella gratiana]
MELFIALLQLLETPMHHVDNVTIIGNDPILPSPFLIGEAGAAVIAIIGYVSSELWTLRNHRAQKISVTVKDAAIAQRSHEYIKVIDGDCLDLWSPISGFYQTQDNRWIQLHCNFPHHQQGVISFLHCENNKTSVTAAVKNWQADQLEEALANLGLCAALVRTPDEWKKHPQSQAIENLPLIEIIKIGASKPEPLPKGNRPLSGIKVLDLTRVIAGPVCGKTLAEHGATVMLISSPELPYILPLVIDTGFGKLSAYLDLNKNKDIGRLIQLIKKTDIFVQAYRPGGLAEKGLSPEMLAKYRPGIIYITFSAYSHRGPWANRHGYDSLVQSATGIVHEQSDSKIPKHLPAQSLDYLTGFLAAAGAMEALRRRTIDGGSYLVRVSLAQTAHWFKQLGRVIEDFSPYKIPTSEQIKYLLTHTTTEFGEIEHLLPVLKMSETPPYWDKPSLPLGVNQPKWP